jgi:hypothetical protein
MIKAIETRYAGCHFRSRLEARWAVFFNELKVRWRYEPEGFSLPSGPYLPDFWLPELDRWFEVKPENASGDDPRWEQLAVGTGKSVVVAFGMPRADEIDSLDYDSMVEYVYYGPPDRWPDLEVTGVAWDNGRRFCICPLCGKVGIEFEGRSARMPCHPDQGDRRHTDDDMRIWFAYEATNSARFEYGQSGA